jgi:hypothetical protein
MATGNQTQITPPRVSLVDERTGAVSRQWYRWFYSLYTFTGEGTGILPVTSGGTGLGTIPTNGQLLIGNGTGYTLNTLGVGAGILVTNGVGTSTVANTGVLSNIAGTGISVSGATGNVTIANTGVLSVSGGTTGLTPAAATTGAVTLAGTLVAVNGGTGSSSFAVGDLLYANTTTTLAKLPDVATGNALISGGVNTAPAWGKIGLTTHVSGVLPIANGGTNATATPTAGAVPYGTGTAYAFSAVGISGQVLTSAGAATPTWTTPTTGTVTSVSFTGGIVSVATATTTPALTVAGTSGGIPYFSSASTWATSAALAAGGLVVGGGAGVTPATTATGTGVVTALGVNVGTAGAVVVNGGALGTPSSGTVTNLTGTASININGTVGATTANTGAFTSITASGKVTATTSSTATGADETGGRFDYTSNTPVTTFNQVGVYGSVSIGASYTGSGGNSGVRGGVSLTAVGAAAGTITGVLGTVGSTAAGTATFAVAFRSAISNVGASTFTNVAAYFTGDITVTASTAVAGFYGNLSSGAANKYNLYMVGTAPNYFAGDLRVASAASLKVIGSGTLGYDTGSGGAVTQGTSRTTGVTLSKSNGAITMFSDLGSAVAATFTVTNTLVAATDTIILNQKSGTNLYVFLVTAVAAGSFNITFYTTGGIATDAPVINFAVIKAVTA